MNCDELRDDYATYALGVLDGPELDELREHLARRCETCTAGVLNAEGMIASMATAVRQVEPPKRLRSRVIAMVKQDVRATRLNWILGAAAVLSVIFSVHIWMRHSEMHEEFLRQDAKWQQQNAELARLNETLAILQDPVAKEVTFGKGARGRVVISPNHGVAFSGQGMAALAPGKTYEMWILPKMGNPVPAGIFAPAADGSAVHLRPGRVDLASTKAVAVSIENTGGVDVPTQVVIVAPVGD
jgi:anti-sigma-K factor RskA